MNRSRSITFVAGVAVVVALAAAGCGSSNDDGANAASAPSNASGQAATVDLANSDLGMILVDSQGRTLYLFQKDSGTTSECTGACASAWPPAEANGQPTVGNGATASLVGTTSRSDGSQQVTYNGHPLYRYQGDQKAGQTNGQGLNAFGGGWFVLSAAGDQVTGQASGSSSGQSSSGQSSSSGNGY